VHYPTGHRQGYGSRRCGRSLVESIAVHRRIALSLAQFLFICLVCQSQRRHPQFGRRAGRRKRGAYRSCALQNSRINRSRPCLFSGLPDRLPFGIIGKPGRPGTIIFARRHGMSSMTYKKTSRQSVDCRDVTSIGASQREGAFGERRFTWRSSYRNVLRNGS